MKINAYKPRTTALPFYDGDKKAPKLHPVPALLTEGSTLGGYNLKTGKVSPFKGVKNSEAETADYLDNITAAVEAGLVDDETFFEDFFASPTEVQALAARLNDMGGWWLNERHYHALVEVLNAPEENCTTYSDLGDELINRAAYLSAGKANTKKN